MKNKTKDLINGILAYSFLEYLTADITCAVEESVERIKKGGKIWCAETVAVRRTISVRTG